MRSTGRLAMALAKPKREAPLPFVPLDGEFNRVNALYLAHAADIAYKRAPAAAAQERLGLRAYSFRSKLTRARGFLGVCDSHAVLSFRGTEPVTLQNWLTVMVMQLIRSRHYQGRVHRGFSYALERVWNKLNPLLDRLPQDKPLFLTGHSMGGALAVLAACRLVSQGRAPVAVYTYGAPRIGDLDFCASYKLPTYRLVNRLDLVPELPLASVKSLLLKKLPRRNGRVRRRLDRRMERLPCYGHVDRLVYLDRDGAIILDAEIVPWHVEAVARAIATRGNSFLEGVTDHLIVNYIRALDGKLGGKPSRNRRRAKLTP